MAARLVCRSGVFAGREIRFEGEATVGRDPANTLSLPDARISTRHARLLFESGRDGADGAYWLEDLGSRNGTFVDGLAVTERERLHGLSVVRFGPEGDFLFQAVAAPATGAAPRTLGDLVPPRLPAALAEPAAPATQIGAVAPPLPVDLRGLVPSTPRAPRRVLRLALEDGSTLRFELALGPNVVGRDPACEIALVHPTLSRRHALLDLRDDRLFLSDLGSTNGTRLGDQRLLPQDPKEWPPGVVAEIGGLPAEWEEELIP